MRFKIVSGFFMLILLLGMVSTSGCSVSLLQDLPVNQFNSNQTTSNPVQQGDSLKADGQISNNLLENNKPSPEAGINKSETGAGENVLSISGELTAKDLASMLTSAENPVLIDVNSNADYKEGHVKSAIWGDFKYIRSSAPEPYLSQLGIKKTDTIVLICEIGNKSAIAVPFLVKTGYSKVYSLKDGNIGWIRAGFKLEK